MTPTILWLRSETKAHEQRTPLTPEKAAYLQEHGYTVHVERSDCRAYKDAEYEKAGCKMEPTGSWVDAPRDAVIFGLKELPEDTTPLKHRHILFAHCYKAQAGWKEILRRFSAGGGTLYDLEFLVDESGRRVAAFGRPAGFVGAAVGLMGWAHRKAHGADVPYPGVTAYATQDDLIAEVRAKLDTAKANNGGALPKVIVIGAKGRCGRGAVSLCEAAGVKPTCWDIEETKKGGPFPEILEHDVFVNCIYLPPGVKIPPFVTKDMIESAGPGRKLAMISDVSCDCTNPDNPVPIYNESTTYDKPFLDIVKDPVLQVLSIDNLPSALPLESSRDFCADLIPHVKDFASNSPVWQRAEKIFREKMADALA